MTSLGLSGEGYDMTVKLMLLASGEKIPDAVLVFYDYYPLLVFYDYYLRFGMTRRARL